MSFFQKKKEEEEREREIQLTFYLIFHYFHDHLGLKLLFNFIIL